jgi:hypothetical protein
VRSLGNSLADPSRCLSARVVTKAPTVPAALVGGRFARSTGCFVEVSEIGKQAFVPMLPFIGVDL